MNHIFFFILFISTSFPAIACSGMPCSDIEIDHVRLVATDTAVRPTALFFTLKNYKQMNLTLTGVTTPLCGRTELHDHIQDGDVMRMRKIDRVKIPARGDIAFVPMGKHVMCFDPILPMVIGAKTPVTFIFSGDDKSDALTTVFDAKIISFKQMMGP